MVVGTLEKKKKINASKYTVLIRPGEQLIHTKKKTKKRKYSSGYVISTQTIPITPSNITKIGIA